MALVPPGPESLVRLTKGSERVEEREKNVARPDQTPLSFLVIPAGGDVQKVASNLLVVA